MTAATHSQGKEEIQEPVGGGGRREGGREGERERMKERSRFDFYKKNLLLSSHQCFSWLFCYVMNSLTDTHMQNYNL